MSRDTLPLIVGLPGTGLDSGAATLLQEVRPAGVILFGRNVLSTPQVTDLTRSVRDLPGAPFVAVDLEGGMVNRLAGLWGTLPSPTRACAAGRRAVRALGEAAGAACRLLGIHLDLAPVVDLAVPEGLIAAQGRCFSDDPERTATLAGVFLEGLHSWCVRGCAKHYPGLGPVGQDTHETLPELDLSPDELARQELPFLRIAGKAGAVMMAHVRVPALAGPTLPASLSPAIVERAASLPGGPVVLSDDLDMGALAGFGTLAEVAEAALLAGNHGLLICNSWEPLPGVAEHLRRRAAEESALRARLEQAVARLLTLSRDMCRTFASEPAPDGATVAQLWEQARREAEP